MKKYSLWVFIIGVIAVLIIMNWLAFMVGGRDKLLQAEIFSAGYLVGMTAMYIAVHVYRWK
jgi:hypothetical protein